MSASYLDLKPKELEKRFKQALRLLKRCRICPRRCGTDRLSNEKKGFCRLGRYAKVSAFHPHFGEEAPLSGRFGSGTIFFAHCNLACCYCQNFDISQMGIGKEVKAKDLAHMMIDLQNQGCHNINFVTPTPNVAQILEALPFAIKQGLHLPLVYNTNAYDAVWTLKLLDGIIDIYMPDAKYSDDQIARKYSLAPGYFSVMKSAIKEMHRQVGDLKFDKEGLASKGLLIRHLVLPGNLAGTEEILKFIAHEVSRNTFINIMDQYRPEYQADKFPPLSRKITNKEFQQAIRIAERLGLSRIYK